MSPKINHDVCLGPAPTLGTGGPGHYVMDGKLYRCAKFRSGLPNAAKPAKPSPPPPPGPPAKGSREWAAQLLRRYGEAEGVDYMTRELSLADAAKEHAAKRAKAEAEKHDAFIKERDRLDGEIAQLNRELARRERPRQLGVRIAPGMRLFGNKHAQRPGGPERPTAA
jgi:hypothetical protein